MDDSPQYRALVCPYSSQHWLFQVRVKTCSTISVNGLGHIRLRPSDGLRSASGHSKPRCCACGLPAIMVGHQVELREYVLKYVNMDGRERHAFIVAESPDAALRYLRASRPYLADLDDRGFDPPYVAHMSDSIEEILVEYQRLVAEGPQERRRALGLGVLQHVRQERLDALKTTRRELDDYIVRLNTEMSKAHAAIQEENAAEF